MSMRVISNLFDTMREHLKLQQELFLSFLMDRLIRPLPGSSHNANVGGPRKGEMESELDASTWNVEETPAMPPFTVNAQGAGGPMKSPHSGLSTPSGERRSSGASSSGAQISGRGDRAAAVVQFSGPAQEARDLMLEYLAQYARAPEFMTNLWVNYDCNVDCEDLFERLIKFFSRVRPLSAALVNPATED